MKTNLDPRVKITWVLISPEGRPGDPVEGRSGKVYGTLLRNNDTGRVEHRMSHEEFQAAAADLFAWRRRHDHIYPDIEVTLDPEALPPLELPKILCGDEEVTVDELLDRLNELEKQNAAFQNAAVANVTTPQPAPTVTTTATPTPDAGGGDGGGASGEDDANPGGNAPETPEGSQSAKGSPAPAPAKKTPSKKAAKKAAAGNKRF